ncbi:UNVERIFIED_CONTAM: hypothetical protein FKN15_017318 [Acipenser sinensis]
MGFTNKTSLSSRRKCTNEEMRERMRTGEEVSLQLRNMIPWRCWGGEREREGRKERKLLSINITL